VREEYSLNVVLTQVGEMVVVVCGRGRVVVVVVVSVVVVVVVVVVVNYSPDQYHYK